MANLNEFFIHELDTPLAGYLKQLDLGLYKEVECHLRDEEAGSRTGRVSNGCSDVESGEVRSGIDRLERTSIYRVEDVVNPGSTTELLGGNLG